MSVQFDSSRNRWVVRWYEAGRQRTRRFSHERAARGFDAQRREATIAAREAQVAELAGELARLRARLETVEGRLPADAQATGVYSYATKQGVRWRIAVKQLDGTLTTRRGYRTHAAASRARERVTHAETPGAEASFGCFWRRWLAEKQPYLTDGSLEDLETHGRKRILPHLAHVPVGAMSEQHIRAWLARMIEQQRSGALSAKTINNARAALSGALASTCCRATPASSSHRYQSSTTSSTTSVSLRSTATSTPAPRTTAHSPNCSLAPALASPKHSPSPGPTLTSTAGRCKSTASSHAAAITRARPKANGPGPCGSALG